MNPSNLMQPFGIDIDLAEGLMAAASRHTVRRASDMRGYYQDQEALAKLIAVGDPVHYEVFEKPVPEETGQLMFCISKLLPGLVGQEFFMTKGHFHQVASTAEIYLCLRGEGFLAMMNPQEECVFERMYRNRMVYVPPYWAHRSINTGYEPLISFCVYPGDAGHNYGSIQTQGFTRRVFRKSGQVVIE